MKEIKLKEKIENAYEAFFDDEKLDENVQLANKSDYLFEEHPQSQSEKKHWLITFLKQAFLFLPGTFFVHILSMVFALIFIAQLPIVGEPRIPYSALAGIFLVSVLSMWFGLGDLKKPKHLVIPFSTVITSTVLGAITGLLLNSFQGTDRIITIIASDLYPLCLFPIALIVPHLAKSWVDRTDE